MKQITFLYDKANITSAKELNEILVYLEKMYGGEWSIVDEDRTYFEEKKS